MPGYAASWRDCRPARATGGEADAGEPRPLQRVFALVDVLLGCAPAVVERQHPLVRQAAICDDETDAG